VRLFIGVDFPQALMESVCEVQRVLRPHDSALRWVRPESIHLTLKFLGTVEAERSLSVDAALKRVQAPAFKVSVSGVGFFPNVRAPRLLWAGVRSESLERLAHSIDGQMAAAGFPAETRKFTPHLTLARCRGGRAMPRDVVRAAQQFTDFEFGSYTVECFYLYESLLDGSGEIHKRLHQYDLDVAFQGFVNS
jgi:2'-5' RNA ligase